MTAVTVSCTLYAGTSATVELPDGKTWADVKEWFVKWDTLHFLLKDETDWRELALDSDTMELVDWKRPSSVTVYPVGEDGETDYGTELGESS